MGLYIMPSLKKINAVSLAELLIYLLLHGDRELLDLVLAMNLSLGCLLCLIISFSILVDKFYLNWVEFASLPVSFSCLSSKNVIINLHFLIMVLQVAISDHIIVSLPLLFHGLASHSFLLSWFWALLRWLEMMVFHVDVTNDVIVNNSVFAGAEIPWLLLGVVWTIFETLKLVIKVQNIIGLLVA